MQRITILGATGSIGQSTLDVVGRHPDRFEVFALTAHRQDDKLVEPCLRFRPRHAVVGSPEAAQRLLAQHPVPPGNARYRDYLWIRAVASLRRGRHDAAIADLEELARHPGVNQAASADLLQKVR